jgi:5-formyltetrahydrofolate cyclo-ligase
MSIVEVKKQLRTEAMHGRDGYEIDDRLDWDQAIARHALALPVWSGVIAGYWPMRSEADPRPILEGLADRGFSLALPAIVEGRIQFRHWQPYETLVPGGFGTLVPLPEADVIEPDILIVPLLAFDRRCYRLGYGKGHYDTAIAGLDGKPGLATIGIAYAGQQIDAVPTEGHDRRLDLIVTQDGVIESAA